MKQIPEITGMRGYASLSVVFFHLSTFGLAVGIAPVSIMVTSWNSGVDFFFVLSGFLLSIPFLQPKGEHNALMKYYLKRIFRTLPVYYLNLVLMGALLLFLNKATMEQLVTGLFFVQSFSQSTFNTINGVNWTLVIEEIFYVTLPLFSILFTKGRWKYSLPCCFAIAILYRIWAVQTFAHNGLPFHLWQYPSFLGHYALGLTLANFYVNRKFYSGRLQSSKLLLIPIGILLATQYYVGKTYGIGNNVTIYPGIIFAFEYGLLIIIALSIPFGSAFGHIFSNRIALFLGNISYSLYTWHLPIEMFLLHSGLPAWEWVSLALLLSLSVATLSYKFVEKPMLKLRDRLLHKEGKGGKTCEAISVAPFQN